MVQMSVMPHLPVFGKEKIMKIQNQIILLKATDNTDAIKAVLNFQKEDEKILLLANQNTSFLKESLEKLQDNMHRFEEIYTHVRCMFLKQRLSILDKLHGKSSFINEIENLVGDVQFSTIYFHRLDALIDCVSQHECEFLVSKIVESGRRFNKKVIFSINNKTEIGQLLDAILSKVATQKYIIGEETNSNNNQLILLNATEDTKLIKSTLNLCQKDKGILFLADKVTLDLKDSFKTLQCEIHGFDEIYTRMSFRFLKDSWKMLDKIYGKVFFLYEMQEMMKDKRYSTLYFHRLDTIFYGASCEDCEQLISDIREFARYYQKKVLFSIDAKTEFGQVLNPILQDAVDYEEKIEKFRLKPANLILPMYNKNQRVSL